VAARLNLPALRDGFFLPDAGTQPLPKSPVGLTPAKLGVVEGAGTVTFTLDGTPRWLIDVNRFAGTPSLKLAPGQGEVASRLTLTGAKLPGTDVPADFVVLIGKTGPNGTSADFAFTFGGFHGQVVLEDWLAGPAVLQSPVKLSGDVCPLGASSKLGFTANGQARFAPDWRMEVDGNDIATVSGLGSPLSTGQLTFQLLAPTDPSISQHPEPKRTLLKMPAGGHIWTLSPQVTSLPVGTLSTAPGVFTAIAIEAGEGPGGDIARELLATSSSATGMTLAVAGGFTDQNGHPFRLALASPSYAIAFDTSTDHSQGDETAVSARFSTPTWLVVNGFALLVGDSSASPGFEYQAIKQKVTSLRCEPALISAAAPLGAGSGASVAADPLDLIGATLPFVTAPGTTPGWGIVAGPGSAGQQRFSLPDFSVSVLRRDDLLALDFQFFNLAMEGGGGKPPQLVRKDSTHPAFLVAQFNSPQNIAEQAYLEEVDDTTPKHQPPPSGTNPHDPQSFSAEKLDPAGKVLTRAAGPSRLAFQLPSQTTALPYSLDALLNWVALQQSVVPVAAVPDTRQEDPKQQIAPQPRAPMQAAQIREPGPTETGIEAPWRVLLSPNYSGAWAHSSTPVTLSNRTELWHTRLAVRTQQGDKFTADETIPRRVRAVWSPDYITGATPGHPPPFGTDPAPFRMSLDPDDRDQIVRLSSDFTMTESPGHAYVPISIPADKLYLSTLGAWIDVFGDWPEPPPALSVEQWQHRAALGRDNYVRVVYAGFLLPFGNAASLVKVTERKLQPGNDSATTAYLRQKFFIIVRQPTISYDTASSALSEAQQRNLPYRSITITTLVTPDVDPKVDGTKHYAFFPTSGPGSFLFHIVGTDWAGGTSEFLAPLFFVERGGDFNAAITAYNASGTGRRQLTGQTIAFAERRSDGTSLQNNTTLQTNTLTFSAQPKNPVADETSPFFPSMEAADVVVPAIQQISGGGGAMSIKYFTDFVTNNWGAGEVFAESTENPLPVGFNGKQSGGVATPNLTVSGLSRKFGTVSTSDVNHLTDINTGKFDAADIFNDFQATLFGVVRLADLLDKAADAGLADPSQLPTLATDRLPDQITTTLSFKPRVAKTYTAPAPIPADFITLNFHGNPSEALVLNATIVTPLTTGGAPGEPQVSIHGELNDFTLELAQVVGIAINQIAFDAPAGQKLSVTASMPATADGPLQFMGDLRFLNELRSFIPSDGFEDPPSLDVSSDGITAGYSLPIPSIGVGVFSLENIALSAALTLPFFTPQPIRFRFNFAERQHPFNITVSLLGGGGFFGITVGPDGVEILEAAIEVGANVSIDVVVASGNVHIMAGVYLKYDMASTPTPSSQLTGYLRAGGSLDVLGLISASVEFYLGFTYFFGPPCSIAGEATITIEVHVLFFSTSVSATLRREFGDPTFSFAELIGPTDWDHYCDAFAA
jgi:hypothetical protein